MGVLEAIVGFLLSKFGGAVALFLAFVAFLKKKINRKTNKIQDNKDKIEDIEERVKDIEDLLTGMDLDTTDEGFVKDVYNQLEKIQKDIDEIKEDNRKD